MTVRVPVIVQDPEDSKFKWVHPTELVDIEAFWPLASSPATQKSRINPYPRRPREPRTV